MTTNITTHAPTDRKNHHKSANPKMGFAFWIGLLFSLAPCLPSFAAELPTPVIEVLADDSDPIQNTGSLGDMLKAQKLEHGVNVSLQQLTLPGGKSISKTVAVAEKPASPCCKAEFPFEEITITPQNGGLTCAFWLNPVETLAEHYIQIWPGLSMLLETTGEGNQMRAALRYAENAEPEKILTILVSSPKEFIIPNEWHFYTVVATIGDGLYFYLDGEEIAHVTGGFPSGAISGDTTFPMKQFLLGGGYPKGDENPQNISKFSTTMVFDKPLSPEQIAELYQRQIGGKP